MGKASTEIGIQPAPAEMQAYLEKLNKVCGYTEPVQLAQIAGADMPGRVGVTDSPHGFLHLELGKVPLIVLRDDLPADRWQSVVAHELLHLIRWATDEWVLGRIADREQETYMRLVENTMKPLHILLLVGGMVNAEWVEGESDATPTP